MLEPFTRFVHEWFRMLARGDWDRACDALDEPNCYDITWTGESIRELIADTFGPGTTFAAAHAEGPQVCVPEAVDVPAHPPHLYELDDGSGYALDHDVPLNGEWSDLTAQFEFLRRPGGFAVILHDLHVM